MSYYDDTRVPVGSSERGHHPYNVGRKTLLIVFTLIQTLIYFDRGGLAVSLGTIRSLYGVSQTDAGLLGGFFLIGYCMTAPVFAHLAGYTQPLKISGYGLIIWIVAVVLTGISESYYLTLICRLATGVGDAAFISLGSTMINSFAPTEQRSTWLTVFYLSNMGVPLGAAIGGPLVDSGLLANDNSWRLIFIGEGILMIPFVIFLFLIQGPASVLEIEEHVGLNPESMWHKFKSVIVNDVYMLTNFAYAAQTFTIGGISYYAVEYFEDVFQQSAKNAGLEIGILSMVAGIIGFLSGGRILDSVKNQPGCSLDHQLLSAVKISLICMVLATPLAMSVTFATKVTHGIPILAMVNLLCFMCMGAFNCIILWAVDLKDRAFASALCVFLIHLLGDAAAPIAIGALQDRLGWRRSLLIGTIPFLICILLLSITYCRLSRRVGASSRVGYRALSAVSSLNSTPDRQTRTSTTGEWRRTPIFT